MTTKKKKTKIAVVAIGGNAIIRPGQVGTIYEQFANTRYILKDIISLIKLGFKIVITHGNGPQIGQRLIQVEETADKVPALPLGVIVAASEGDMGYMIQQSLLNLLHKAKLQKSVVTILTQVIVDENDPQIHNPTKPVGRFYNEEEAGQLMKQKGWVMRIQPNGLYRRVVPSPTPLEIVEKETIRILIDNDIIPIACGGGGIPVFVMENGLLEGIDGVIDKDLSSAVLARDIKADYLIILMDIENVALNFGKPNQINLVELSVQEAKRYLAEGHFPPGSMGPKIKAAIDFLESGGERVIICSGKKLLEALEGKSGTTIYAESSVSRASAATLWED